MLPVLLDLKFLKILYFWHLLGSGFFFGLLLSLEKYHLTSIKKKMFLMVFFLSLTGGLFFSRLIYVVLNYDKFGFYLLKFILINVILDYLYLVLLEELSCLFLFIFP
jgi:hypothetical protein